MEYLIRLFLHQWQKKLVALLAATIIWLFVNNSIITTKTIPAVPVRVINLPVDKTIPGLLSNGFLSKRTTLTLTGTKDVIEQLESGDLEVVVDTSNQSPEGIVQLSKKNLVSLNPNINLSNHVTGISHPEIVIKLSQVKKEKIPITIVKPYGRPPEGYEFIDFWPIKLYQEVSGPEEVVQAVKDKGIELSFSLDLIKKEELDQIQMHEKGRYDDEVIFFLSDKWKKIVIPSLSLFEEPLNDPDAKNLQFTFLRQREIPLKEKVQVMTFYPIKYSQQINPETFPLKTGRYLDKDNGIYWLATPLFTRSVSQLFVDMVQENLALVIATAPKEERETLEWSVQLINQSYLEDAFVGFLMSTVKPSNVGAQNSDREQIYRKRFRHYFDKFALFQANQQPLALDCSLSDSGVVVNVPNSSLR